MIVILKLCGTVPAVLVAVIVPVKVPTALGVPVMAPALLKLKPVGKAPAVTENVGAGKPVAAQLKL